MKILFAGGGSIGHIAPSVAVWRAVEMLAPDATAHFVCSQRGDDAAFLQAEHVPFSRINARRLSFFHPLHFWRAMREARLLLQQEKPDVVFCKGGALCVTVAWAAKRHGIPIVLHESDAVSGRANALIARWATVICEGFPRQAIGDTREAVSNDATTSRFIFTGNPVRPAIVRGSRAQGLRITGFTGERPVLIVLGGSQGAVALNEAVWKQLQALLAMADIIHLTGKGKSGAHRSMRSYWTAEFAQETLPHLYALADLALSRAGAGLISELAASAIPALLVPLRGVAHDHQWANAEAAALSGGCRVLHQETLDRTLVPSTEELLHDPAERKKMSERIHALFVPDAAERLAHLLLLHGKGK